MKDKLQLQNRYWNCCLLLQSHAFSLISQGQDFHCLLPNQLSFWVLPVHDLIFGLFLYRNRNVTSLIRKDNLTAFQAQACWSSLQNCQSYHPLSQSVLYRHCSLFSSLTLSHSLSSPNANRCSSLLLQTADGITKEEVLLAFILLHQKTHFQLHV